MTSGAATVTLMPAAFAPRRHVARALEYLGTKRELRPPKKHGLMPL